MLMMILTAVAGLVALVVGGELLVRGAVQLAERARVTPLIVGLVIVGFGTSMPELVTSVEAALRNAPGIAWGNIVGSNIANSLLILGMAAAITPIILGQGKILRDPTIAVAASAFLLILAMSGSGSFLFGVTMIAGLIAYIAYCYRQEKRIERQAGTDHVAPIDKAIALELADPSLHGKRNGWGKPVAFTLIGLLVLIAGGHLLVGGAVDIARIFGLSETIIGLTIVAVGTSLPELVTTVIAAWRKQAEVAFGNVIGSNIYNILGIGGTTMLLAPGAIPADLISRDLPVMAATALLLLLVCFFLRRFGRVTGLLLVAGYCGYLGILVTAAL